MFFDFTFSEVTDDVKYILNKYFPTIPCPDNMIGKRTRFDNNAKIFKLLGYRPFNEEIASLLSTKALEVVKTCADLRFVLDELLSYLEQLKVSIPGYSTLQKIISKASIDENERIQAIIRGSISSDVDKDIQKLLTGDEKMYGITLLKKDAKGFNYLEGIKEIDKKISSQAIFDFAEEIIPKLGISDQNVLYYASLVDYYTVDKLNEILDETVRMYVLCYVFYRFQKINDNLVNSFTYHLNYYKKQAKVVSKEKAYEYKVEANSYTKKIEELIDLYIDKRLKDSISFGKVRKEEAFRIVKEADFALLKKSLHGMIFDEEAFQWEHYVSIAKTMVKNLRPLARAIDFESSPIADSLITALDFLKNAFTKKTPLKRFSIDDFPVDFIPPGLASYLYTEQEVDGKNEKVLNVHLYEFLVYYRLEFFLGNGSIFVSNSLSFKSLRDDLYDVELWEKNKDKIIKEQNNDVLNTPISAQLISLQQELDPLILQVNQHIKDGTNKELCMKKDGTWTLPYQKQDIKTDSLFYGQFPQTSLNQVFRHIDDLCHFMDDFTHIKPRYVKNQKDKESIIACIIANATNYGVSAMSEISDLDYDTLFATSKNFIRLECLRKANDTVVNYMSSLPIYKYWSIAENKLFGSLDGKKFQTKCSNIMARFSPKYFGQKRGIVSYSMVCNFAGINGKIIGANDHESHHLYDIVRNNSSDIQPDWYCGDTHSINSVNYALLHLLGYHFAPHIKRIGTKATTTISSFHPPKFYKKKGYNILPTSQISTNLIKEEWGNIEHIFASLLMGKTTQSIVVKKLSSYARTNKTQKALCEYNKIFMSLHILNFMDDPLLRRYVRTALNRGEAYHQLTGKMSNVNGGKFIGTTELELAVTNDANRLAVNIAVCYTAVLLSKIYEVHEKLGHVEILEFLKKRSPGASCHINFNGRYEFTTGPQSIDLDSMITNLSFDFLEEEVDTE